MYEAVAESVDGRVIARSAADKAELCIALGNCGVARKIAALLLFKCDCRDIRESLSVAVGEDIAVDEDKLCIGIFRCGSFESVLLLIAGGDDYIRAAFYCFDKRIVSVVIRSFVAVSGLIIFIRLAVFIGKELDSVPGSLVERFILEPADIRDHCYFIFSVFRGHCIGNFICRNYLVVSRLGRETLFTACGKGGAAENQKHRKKCRKGLLHCKTSYIGLTRPFRLFIISFKRL